MEAAVLVALRPHSKVSNKRNIRSTTLTLSFVSGRIKTLFYKLEGSIITFYFFFLIKGTVRFCGIEEHLSSLSLSIMTTKMMMRLQIRNIF